MSKRVTLFEGTLTSVILACGIALLSPTALAGLESSSESGDRHLDPVLRKVASNSAKHGGVFRLTQDADSASLGITLPQGVQLSRGQGYRLDLSGSQQGTLQSYIDGIKVCGSQLKTVGVGQETYLVGAIPSAEPRRSFNAEDFAFSTELTDRIAERFYGQEVRMSASAPCLYPESEAGYRPAQEVWFAVGDRLYYRGYHDGDQFIELHPIGFDVDGSARIYDSNPREGTIRVFNLLGLTETGRLGNRYFVTKMNANGGNTDRVLSSNNQFYYDSDTSSDAFAEASVFTNANRILGFFSSLEYTESNFGSRTITLNLAPGFAGNAQYIPSNTGSPVISIGEDEPGRLENLRLDMDVVNHEFGHHVVFGSLQDTGKIIDGSRQVLVMHEALADYFSFAFSGDSCLGESLCPSGSQLCAVANQCLRSANTLMTMTSDPSIGLNKEHLRGQFMSAFLWNVRSEASVDKTTFDKLVLKAVKLLRADSGYQDMLLNLHIADRDSNNGSYCSIIKSKAEGRELNKYLAYDCASGEYERLSLDGGSSNTGTTKSSKHSSGGFFSFCGTVKGHPPRAADGIWYLLAALLPILIVGRRRKEGAATDA